MLRQTDDVALLAPSLYVVVVSSSLRPLREAFMSLHHPTLHDIMMAFSKADYCRRYLEKFDDWLAGLPPLPVGREEDMRKLPKTEAVVRLLEGNPHKSFTTREIVDVLQNWGLEFSGNAMSSTSSMLSRHASLGRIKQVSRGKWQANKTGRSAMASFDAMLYASPSFQRGFIKGPPKPSDVTDTLEELFGPSK